MPSSWPPPSSPPTTTCCAAGVVDDATAVEELGLALDQALGGAPSGGSPQPAEAGTSIVVLRTPYDVDAVLPVLRRALADDPPR